jgi:hypothetical protein
MFFAAVQSINIFCRRCTKSLTSDIGSVSFAYQPVELLISVAAAMSRLTRFNQRAAAAIGMTLACNAIVTMILGSSMVGGKVSAHCFGLESIDPKIEYGFYGTLTVGFQSDFCLIISIFFNVLPDERYRKHIDKRPNTECAFA